MDELLRSVLLAILQGLTEFLPISSSAHLILPSQLLGWPDQGLAFDVAVHLGTLVAVALYFRAELLALVSGSVGAARCRAHNEQSRLLLYLVVATLPVGVAGLVLDDWVGNELRGIAVIAGTTVGFGILLGVADYRGRGDGELNLRAAVIIGLAQALAIVPGTSRSGITMTAALFCGLSRQAAARFSFLLSIPVILAAGGLKMVELSTSAVDVDWHLLAIATAVAAITAYLTIAWFLRLLDRVGFLPFVLYRCMLGFALFFIWL